jgi:hypothetical protein
MLTPNDGDAILKLIEPDHPFYQPVGTRLAIVATTIVWSAVEVFYARDGFWSIIAVSVMALCVWTFFLNWKGKGPDKPTQN